MTESVMPLHTASPNIGDAIAQTVGRLRQLTQTSVQNGWRLCLADLPPAQATQFDNWKTWDLAVVNGRNHIAWEKGRRVLWLGQRLVIPSDLQGYPLTGLSLRLSLIWWAELAQVFVNGTLVQEGDLFDVAARVMLSAAVQPGEPVDVAIRLVSPRHDDGALVQSICLYETDPEASCPEPGFVADEMAVLQQYLTTFQPKKLTTLADALQDLDWTAVSNREAFERSLVTLRQRLQPLGEWLKQRQIQLVGHAHLDLAWLWPVEETWRAAERTFKSVLQLQKEHPDLIFCHSTPALYDWLERNRPDLFKEIQTQTANGRWEVVAGLWVEPEFNLVNGESLVRQVLYGQRYVQQKFGEISTIAWLPDSFGFCWQLPQVLVQGGVQYFVTQKLRWNDTNEFTDELFWWRSPDGSQILSFHSPRIGEGIDPLKMAHYACTWESKTGILQSLWLPGVGDHGGGPTRDMLAIARRWQQSPFFPTLSFTTVYNYLCKITASLPAESSQNSKFKIQNSTKAGGKRQEAEGKRQEPNTQHPTPDTQYPIWNDELYLEFHRGCYTTHADQKRWNRRCEILLYQAELFSALATRLTTFAYPHEAIETAWKRVLFNQFHDILPGSSIPEVFVDANCEWQAAEQAGEHMVHEALQAIAAHVSLPQPPHPQSYPVFLFNSLNWSRTETVSVPLPFEAEAGHAWQLYARDGQQLDSQEWQDEQGNTCLRFLASEVPGIGYETVWLYQVPSLLPLNGNSAADLDLLPEPESWMLENEWLRVVVDAQTGELSSIFDKVHQREALAAPGNQLQAFHDQGQYWDAWNIDPHYADHPLPSPILRSIEWVNRGAIASRLRVVRQLGQSLFQQDYVLEAAAPILKIVSVVDWQERQVLVKAAFPLQVDADHATYEMPFGAIQRPTRSDDPRDKAKWEVPALQWADLSDSAYGVSVLNDCKYGYDAQPSQVRLTLLRSPNWPDPQADVGRHQFTYAVYPHIGDWRSADTVRRGYELNQPIQVLVGEINSSAAIAHLPPSATLLDVPNPNLVVTAFKRAEDDDDAWILRVYECHGEIANLDWLKKEGQLSLWHSTDAIEPVNLLEQPTPPQFPTINKPAFAISPWQIASFQIHETDDNERITDG
jgi:alpha-mannosidase